MRHHRKKQQCDPNTEHKQPGQDHSVIKKTKQQDYWSQISRTETGRWRGGGEVGQLSDKHFPDWALEGTPRRQWPRASKGAETLQLQSPPLPPARARRPQREAQPAHVGGGGTDGLGVLLTQALQVSQSVPPRQADTYLKRNAKVRLTRKAIQC